MNDQNEALTPLDFELEGVATEGSSPVVKQSTPIFSPLSNVEFSAKTDQPQFVNQSTYIPPDSMVQPNNQNQCCSSSQQHSFQPSLIYDLTLAIRSLESAVQHLTQEMWMTRNARQMKRRKMTPDQTVNQCKKVKLEDSTTTTAPAQQVHQQRQHQQPTAPPQQILQAPAQCSQRSLQQQSSQPRSECVFCGRLHWANSCNVYTTLSARRDRIKQKGRCERCLGLATHLVTSCQPKYGCFFCKQANRTGEQNLHNSCFCPYEFRL